MTVTIRQAATALLGTFNPLTIHEALAVDPLHPLLPFALAFLETRTTDTEPANPDRTAWLIDYGMKRLPADTSAADLRLAARCVAKVAESLPAQKPAALALLDRAAKLAPEDDETRKLRESLK